MTKLHGGKILAQRLAMHGVERVFSVPGESFLAALDGLHDADIPNIVCRQEGGAAMMAEAHGKMTGQPGVLFVTRGPGATNASAGLHIAMHDATPMVCFVGQIPLKHRDRGVFQEVDYRAFFGPLVKWVAEVERTDRLAEYIDRAFAIAQSGRPGPVVLALPEDILSAMTDPPATRPGARAMPSVHPDMIAPFAQMLRQAERPLIICGGSHWSDTDRQSAEALAERTGAPIGVTFRRQDYINNDHPNYAGDFGVGMNPALGARLAESDCILLLGAELNDITTGDFTLLDPAKAPAILQVHPDADAISKTYPATYAVAAPPSAILHQLIEAIGEHTGDKGAAEARAGYEAWQEPQPTPGDVQMEHVIAWLRDHASPDTIITNGAGNYAAFLHRYYRFRQYGTQVAPTSGSMGYCLPAAVSAKLQNPQSPVICLAGDGCLQMTIQELSTARQYGADITVIVANNGRYGTIRMHQEKNYPGRVSGTDLFNPDYATLAKAYGGTGHTITSNEQFADAYTATLNGGLHIIELKLDPKMLATTKSL
ncbi:thiamine pyrophosphate-binding protein [Gymnodinialimonas hymeniacidonis]|uniref:thiamine pyrophosphate-binding protein n=1 Tax=Gymnodinialimonas hymeniacidonis TaxID=3126508 RepID=UPI0034C5B248